MLLLCVVQVYTPISLIIYTSTFNFDFSALVLTPLKNFSSNNNNNNNISKQWIPVCMLTFLYKS